MFERATEMGGAAPPAADDGPWKHHLWVREHGLDAFCLSVCTASRDATLVALDADVSSVQRFAFGDIPWESDDEGALPPYEAVQVAERDGLLVCLELNGWLGAEDRVAEALSRSGFHAAVYEGGNGLTQFLWAVDGRVVRSFDPVLSGPGMRWPTDVGEPLPEEAGLPWGDTDQPVMAAAVLLVERLTGIALDPEWLLLEPQLTYRWEPTRARDDVGIAVPIGVGGANWRDGSFSTSDARGTFEAARRLQERAGRPRNPGVPMN